MTRQTKLGKGWAIGKDGKLVKTARHLDTSAQIRKRKAANKPRVVSRAKAGGVR